MEAAIAARPPAESAGAQCRLELRQAADELMLELSGPWRFSERLPRPDEVWRQVDAARPVHRLGFKTEAVTAWDSGLVSFLVTLVAESTRRNIRTDLTGFPEGVGRLLALATAVPERGAGRRRTPDGFLSQAGRMAMTVAAQATSALAFVGEAWLGGLALLRGRSRYRRGDLFLLVQECGAQALPIVTLISFLVGVILAYVGAVQLRQFGAQIYVADLVGIAMTREMGAMMAAVIMAGRTAAAFAASLGTMQVNEEIDALTTLGISAVDFLVLPRILALTAMMPLLCIYADLLGILGGACVAVGMLDLGSVEYFVRTSNAITLQDILAGLVKSGIFGLLVSLAGCLRGMQCGRSSAAVGWAATSAVVTGIVLIVVSDALLTVLFNLLGF